MSERYDLAVVGAGIVGLGCALAAAKRGLRVIVIDRNAQADGASVRNFGFVTVTGQQRGLVWQRACRSRDIWLEVAAPAGIEVLQRGLFMVVRRDEAAGVLEEFMATEMGEGCELLSAAQASARAANAIGPQTRAALFSPHDLRIESRSAIPLLARYLERAHGVTFQRETAVLAVEPPHVLTGRGEVLAERAIICPGDDFSGLGADILQSAGLLRSKLQMLRLAAPGFTLPSAIMSDLGLVRYEGYSALPAAGALRARLEQEQGEELANGVHLIAVQSADGTLVVGDSHHDAPTPDPFASEAVNRLILAEWSAATGQVAPPVLERWTGTYARGPEPSLIATPHPRVRLALITAGNGASTAFAFAEEVLANLFEESSTDD